MKKPFQAALIISIFLSLTVVSSALYAGECKVSQPSANLLADAYEMAKMNEIQLARLSDEFQAKTGQPLQVVIVARAGQDLSDLTVLADEKDSRPMSLADIYKAASADDDAFIDNGSTKVSDYSSLLDVIQRKFKDPKRKMDFSHVGFMIRNHPSAPTPEAGTEKWWWARHMLRPCENKDAKSEIELLMQKNLNVPYLWDEGSGNFFADDPYELKVRYIVPSPQLQARLMEVLFEAKTSAGQPLVYALNSRFYNAAANWKNTEENNSNQWVLEILAAASQPRGRVQNRQEAQQVLAQLGYQPTKVYFTGKQSKAYIPFARKIAPSVTYHANEQPFYFKAAIGELISALSVEEFMQKNAMVFEARTSPTLEKTAAQ